MSFLHINKFIIILLSATILAACVNKQSPQLKEQSAVVFMHSIWQLQGVLSYRDDKKGFSASYVWQNKPNQYIVQMIAPMGAWRAKLVVNQKNATLSTSDGKILQADNPSKLMKENLDWFIPVENLHYWLGGLPAPHQPFNVQKNAQNDIMHLTQSNWSVDYFDYHNFSQVRLPKKIILSQGKKKITLVVQNVYGL